MDRDGLPSDVDLLHLCRTGDSQTTLRSMSSSFTKMRIYSSILGWKVRSQKHMFLLLAGLLRGLLSELPSPAPSVLTTALPSVVSPVSLNQTPALV